MPRNGRFAEAEIVVLCGVFSVNDFSAGDDEKTECKRIAAALNRRPGTIDRQWRNIKDYLAGLPARKTGQEVKRWADVMLQNPALVRSLATHYCVENNWNLIDILEAT